MIIITSEENFNEEIFEVKMDSEEKTIKSSPLQEITNEDFLRRGITTSPESITISNIVSGNLLEVNSDTT